jgi:RimJ/RimL family protein N-acetyltransferase
MMLKFIETGRIVAQRSYLQINPNHGTVELGRAFTFLKGPSSRINVEIQWLLINHAFELGFRRIHFMAVVHDSASNKALEDFGNQYEGVHRNMRMKQDEFYEHNKIVEENDMVVTSVLSSEWPLLRRVMEEWMDDSNVDQNGQPIQKYEDIRNRVFAEANGKKAKLAQKIA